MTHRRQNSVAAYAKTSQNDASTVYVRKLQHVLSWIATALIMSFLAVATPVEAGAAPFEGAGTIDNPYLLQTTEDYQQLRRRVNSGESFEGLHFRQTEDLDFSGVDWSPIGNTANNAFMGYLDGAGHEIKNVEVSQAGENISSVGLFGYLGGKIVNLVISQSHFEGTYAGSFAAQSAGTGAAIINCISSADVSGATAGGIAASFEGGVIANCVSSGEVSGDNAFGIVAENSDVKIYRCYTTSERPALPAGVASGNCFSIQADQLYEEAMALKMSISAALVGPLFLGDCGLVPMEWSPGEQHPEPAPRGLISLAVDAVNLLAIPLLLCAYCACLGMRIKKLKRAVDNKPKCWESGSLFSTQIFIIGSLTFFFDSFAVLRHPARPSIGFVLTAVLLNGALLATVLAKLRLDSFVMPKPSVGIIIVIIVAVAAELLQFGVVPHFDANIYYGSFIRGCQLYNFDLLTFVGAFNCWKWMQGIAIFSAPIELMLPGTAWSIYIGEVFLTIVTVPMFASLIRKMYRGLTPFQEACACLAFLFSPYILGLFSYFTTEWHLAFYAIWAAYYLSKADVSGICFSGFLLAFTKITGAVYYGALLFGALVWLVIKDRGANRKRASIQLVTGLMMCAPLLATGLLLVLGDELTIQSFYGTYVSSGGILELWNKNQIANTVLHSFVFGFRWLLVLLIMSGMALALVKRRADRILTPMGKTTVASLICALLAVVAALCVYKSDANCPRYTTIISTVYALLLPFPMLTLLSSNRLRSVMMTTVVGILAAQTYWTVDPSIIALCSSVETGTGRLYRLAYSGDTRSGMTLSSGWNNEYPLICDIYSYNYQYTLYDGLLGDMLGQLSIDSESELYCLNVGAYEIDFSGRGYGTYDIFYSESDHTRSYNPRSGECLPFSTLLYDDANGFNVSIDDLPDEFYLLVPYRAYSDDAVEALCNEGYNEIEEVVSKTLYGEMKTYHFKRAAVAQG